MQKLRLKFRNQDWFTPHRFFALQKSGAGFTALYAVLVASLALAIGLAVANIALKESLLSSTARESQFAFYAANSGLECGRFWDGQGVFVEPLGGSIYCNDPLQSSPITVADDNGEADCNPCRFQIIFTSALEETCADIEVFKELIVSGFYSTILRAQGYNTCDENDPRRVERTFTLFYVI